MEIDMKELRELTRNLAVPLVSRPFIEAIKLPAHFAGLPSGLVERILQ